MKTENDQTFSLFAPTAKDVHLVLVDRDDGIPMEFDESDQQWKVRVPLPDGEHRYLFRLRSASWTEEGEEPIEIIDPRAFEVSSDRQHAIARIVDGKWQVGQHEWQHDEVGLLPGGELVIYELHPGFFCCNPDGRASLSELTNRIDYLQDLGITAVETTPLTGRQEGDSWGYTPSFFFSVDPDYGNPEKVQEMIDRCHQAGMRVFLDLVINHANQEIPLTKIDHDLWFHHEPQDPDNSWGPQFNFNHQLPDKDIKPAWQFMGDCLRHWIQTFHIDGLRLDAVAQVDNGEFLNWFSRSAHEWAGPQEFYLMIEHLPFDPAVLNDVDGVEAAWHDDFAHTFRDLLCGGDWDGDRLEAALDPGRRGFHGPVSIINYISTHDTGNLLPALESAGISDEFALHRMYLAFSCLLTAVGVPLIWMGDEFGGRGAGTPEAAPMDWLLLEQDAHARLHDFVRGCIDLRRQEQALHSGNIEFIARDDERRLLAWKRWDDAGSVVVVAANFSDDPVDWSIPGVDGVQMQDWFGDEDISGDGSGALTLHIDSWQARLIHSV